MLWSLLLNDVLLNSDPVKEILTSDLYFNEEVIILWKIYVKMKSFASSFFTHSDVSLTKKIVVIRATEKKLNKFTLQLPIY